MKKKNLQKMSYAEMVAERDKLRKELLNLRVEQVMSHLDNPLALRTVRRDIARQVERLEMEARKKTFNGIVVSDKMDKTIVVEVTNRTLHPLYKKYVNSTKKIKAHDERNEAHVGDTVRVMECRHLSKDKCWRLVQIVEKAR